METGLIGTFRLTVRDDFSLEWPRAETPTHMITMAFDPDLDNCVVTAVRQMLELVCERTGIDRYQAYTLLSVAADLRITQVVNGNKGVHLMLDKRYLSPSSNDEAVRYLSNADRSHSPICAKAVTSGSKTGSLIPVRPAETRGNEAAARA